MVKGQKKLVKLVLLIIGILTAFVIMQPQDVDGVVTGTNIKKHPKAIVVNQSTRVPEKYAFIPRVIAGKFAVEPWGKGGEKNWYQSSINSNGSLNSWSIRNPKTSDKGKFGVTYKNIGTYKDRWIDMKVTVTNWQDWNLNNQRIISYGRYAINHSETGFLWVEQTWEYIDSVTKKPVVIDGSYITINDIDANQGVEFDNATFNKIQNMYVTNDAWSLYEKTSFGTYIKAPDGRSSSNNDEFAMVSPTFNATSILKFRWHADYKDRGTGQWIDYGNATHSGNEYFSFLGKKPAPHEIVTPKKTITDKSNQNSTENTISANDTFEYNVTHKVLDEWGKFYYKSYEISDNIDSRLDIISKKIINESGKDVTNMFDNKSSGNNLIYTAKATTLNSASFYGHDYTMNVKVKVKDGVLNGSNIQGDLVINNKAVIKVNNSPKNTNNVVTKLPVVTLTENHNLIKKKDKNQLLGVIKTNTRKMFKGQSYRVTKLPDGIHTLNGKKYYYFFTDDFGKTEYTGVINENLVFNFYYYPITYSVGIEDTIIDTQRAEQGLKAKTVINVNPLTEGNDYQPDLAAKIKIEVLSKIANKVVYSKESTLKEMSAKDGFNFIIPVKDFMSKDMKDDFTIRLIAMDDKAYMLTNFNNGKEELNLEGYTASLKSIKENAKTKTKIEYGGKKTVSGKTVHEGVVRTHVNRKAPNTTDYKYETLEINFPKYTHEKSGYGKEMNYDSIYTNEIETDGNKLPRIPFKLFVPNEIVDNTMKLPVENGSKYYELEKTNESVSGQKIIKQVSRMPEIAVEVRNGNSYLMNQHEASQVEAINGGRKLYTPIWIDELREYTVTAVNSRAIGVNEVSVEMKTPIDIYAFMYATMDSDTMKMDELLLTPIYPDSQTPDGWTREEEAWLRRE